MVAWNDELHMVVVKVDARNPFDDFYERRRQVNARRRQRIPRHPWALLLLGTLAGVGSIALYVAWGLAR